MACSKDQGCLTIANSIYPGLQSEINSSVKTITTGLNEITTELNTLTIPDDYLGEKVKKELESITSNLNNDQSNIVATSGNIGMFIGRKVEEHRNHYNAWKKAQDELKKKQAEEEKDN